MIAARLLNCAARWLLPVVICAGVFVESRAALLARYDALDDWVEAREAALVPVATTRQELRDLAGLRRADALLDLESPATLAADLALTQKVLRAVPRADADDPELRSILDALVGRFLADARRWEGAVSRLVGGSVAARRSLERVHSSIERAEAETEPVSRLRVLRRAVERADAAARMLNRATTLPSGWRIANVDVGPCTGPPMLFAVAGDEVVVYTRLAGGVPEVRSATIRDRRLVAGAAELEGVSLVDAAADSAGGLHLVVIAPPVGTGQDRAQVDYAYRDPLGAWSRETLALAASSSDAAITVDTADRIWVVLVTPAGNGMQVLSRTVGTVWRSEDVALQLAASGVEVQSGAIAAGGDGVVHVLYAGGGVGDRFAIHAARAVDGSWSARDTVGYRPDLAGSGALRAGADGTLHMFSVLNRDQPELRYGRKRPAGAWEFFDVRALFAPVPIAFTLAEDGAGGVQVLFGASGGCELARLPSGEATWRVDDVVVAKSSFAGASCLADSHGRVHAALLLDGAVRYVWR